MTALRNSPQPNAGAVFACCCATRLSPAFLAYCAQVQSPNRTPYAEFIDLAWDLAAKTQPTPDRSSKAVIAITPTEDAEPWIPLQTYAEDAGAALAYVFRCCDAFSSQEAAWAARRAYEAADQFAIRTLNVELNSVGAERRILESRIVQRELERQARDLRQLLSGAKASELRSIVALESTIPLE